MRYCYLKQETQNLLSLSLLHLCGGGICLFAGVTLGMASLSVIALCSLAFGVIYAACTIVQAIRTTWEYVTLRRAWNRAMSSGAGIEPSPVVFEPRPASPGAIAGVNVPYRRETPTEIVREAVERGEFGA